jgi:hypothetical protein
MPNKNTMFYYLRDDDNRPTVTVCLRRWGHATYSRDTFITRGIAICSERDMPSKKIGRSIAEGRAFKALLNNYSPKRRDFICRQDALRVLMAAGEPGLHPEKCKAVMFETPKLLSGLDRYMAERVWPDLFPESKEAAAS